MRKCLMAITMVVLLSLGAIVSAPVRGGEQEEMETTSDYSFEIGFADVGSEIKLAEPYVYVHAEYSRWFSIGQLPENYVFSWETTIDGELYNTEEKTVETCEDEYHYTVESAHKMVVPEEIPEGEFTTELTVHAEYEDGSLVELASASNSFYYEGYPE